MNYAIFRSKPIMTTNALAGIGAHDKREKEKYLSNPDIDTTRSHENIELVPCDKTYVERFYEITKPYKDEWDLRMKTERPDRKRTFTKMVNDGKNVVADELILTASHNFFNDMNREQITKWGNHCMDFVYNDLGYNKNQIISSIIHIDETTPHLHVVVVPLIKRFDKRSKEERYTISKKNYIHDKMHLSELQDKYHKRMTENGYDLLRGESKFGREYIPVNELKRMTRMLNKDLNIKHNRLDNSILKLEENMKSNKDIFLDKDHVKIKKETFENIKSVLDETKEVLKVQPKLESAFKKVDSFNRSYNSLQQETEKYKKEIDILEKENQALKQENHSLLYRLECLFDMFKKFLRKLLQRGNDYTKDETADVVKDCYDNEEFEMKDVVAISRGTTKQDELFDYVGAPDYYKERVKDYDEYEHDKDNFDLGR